MQGASIEVSPGTMATIIGANGAGKTTLLNAAVGLIPATGHFEFDGHALDLLDVEDRAEMGLCLVPERRELFGTMSVEDNLQLGFYVHRRQRGRWVTVWPTCSTFSRNSQTPETAGKHPFGRVSG